MFVEVIYGLLSNSLGLLTDGAHMLLDCTAVVIGLYSSYLSEFKSNNNYNYGYFRSEILGTFINSVFLFFIAVYIVFESIERFIEPKEIDSENLILVSFLGLVVNIIGLVFAHDHGDHDHGHEHCHEHSHEHEDEHDGLKKEENHKDEHHEHDHDHEHNENKEEKIHKKEHKNEHDHHHHEHKNENIYAIYIHILADTLGSVAVLISSFLVKYYKLYISDPICSLFISAMIIFSTIPVLKNASMVLLHIPNNKISKKKKKLNKV
jgi:zinc transporter 5/7